MKAVALAMVVLCSACAPLPHHGPWVRDGLQGNIMMSMGMLRGDYENEIGVAADGGLRVGVVPADSAVPAFAIGAQIPLLPAVFIAGEGSAEFVNLVTLDGYMTAVRPGTVSTALGISKSWYHTMPYMQVGERAASGKGWYTTQAFMFREDKSGVMWLPSFTFVEPSRRPTRTSSVTLGGGLSTGRSEPNAMFYVALSFEFHGRDRKMR